MRQFALTYPQLMNQAMALSVQEPELAQLRAAYDFTESMVDGLYRAQGVPFTCHLVRCASVVLAEGLPLTVVRAAMVHAAYRLSRFRGSRRRPNLGAARRREIRQALGDAVETVLWRYEQFPWYRLNDLQQHLAQIETYDDLTRQVLIIRLADELDDWLDGGLAYCDRECVDTRIQGYGPCCVELARRLGHPALADDLTEAMEQACRPVPDVLVRRRSSGYERSRRHRWEMTAPERVLLWTVRQSRKLLHGR